MTFAKKAERTYLEDYTNPRVQFDVKQGSAIMRFIFLSGRRVDRADGPHDKFHLIA
jgi:hypothetical protein